MRNVNRFTSQATELTLTRMSIHCLSVSQCQSRQSTLIQGLSQEMIKRSPNLFIVGPWRGVGSSHNAILCNLAIFFYVRAENRPSKRRLDGSLAKSLPWFGHGNCHGSLRMPGYKPHPIKFVIYRFMLCHTFIHINTLQCCQLLWLIDSLQNVS